MAAMLIFSHAAREIFIRTERRRYGSENGAGLERSWRLQGKYDMLWRFFLQEIVNFASSAYGILKWRRYQAAKFIVLASLAIISWRKCNEVEILLPAASHARLLGARRLRNAALYTEGVIAACS